MAPPYATADQLAQALRVQVTPKTQPWLDACVAAASAEIDHAVDRLADDPMPTPTPALATVVCVARGCEWWKANDAAYGGLGFADTGVLRVPTDSFARHAANLIPLTQRFGIA